MDKFISFLENFDLSSDTQPLNEAKFTANKAKKRQEEILDFLQKRREGARKIYNDTASKGGPAQLTAWHFKAKDRQYLDAISAVKNNRPESYFKNQVNSLIGKIRAGKNKQKNFQELMGELEVWGEIYAELFGE